MILYTNGCSFTYGDELKEPNKTAWSYVLANKLNIDVINEAQNGNANIAIYRTTLNFLLKNKSLYKDLFIIIGWSHIKRIEYCKSGCFQRIVFANHKFNFKNILEQNYMIHFYPYSYEFYSLALYNILKRLNINFLFFNAMDIYREANNIPSILLNIYDKQLLKKNKCMPPIAMNEYLHTHNYAFNKNFHPKEEGHKAWADYLYDYIMMNNIL